LVIDYHPNIAIDRKISATDKAHHGGLALNQESLSIILGPSLVNFATDAKAVDAIVTKKITQATVVLIDRLRCGCAKRYCVSVIISMATLTSSLLLE
jgi:hypothetical protein